MRLRIYLDTSVISACVDDRLPDRMRATIDFWGRLPEYEASISELAVAEVRAAKEADRRQQMENLIRPSRSWSSGRRAVGWPASTFGEASFHRQPSKTPSMWQSLSSRGGTSS
jgi:hypothetical protein